MTKLTNKPEERLNLDGQVIDRLLHHIADLETRLTEVETSNGQAAPPIKRHEELGNNLQNRLTALQSELDRVNQRAANMRLDRQMKIAAFRLKEKITPKQEKAPELSPLAKRRELDRIRITGMMTVKNRCAIICGAYPGGSRAYGGQFIQSRVDFYYRNNFKPTIIEVSASTREVVRHKVNGVDVVRVNAAGLIKLLRLSSIQSFGVHSIEKPVWNVLKSHLTSEPLFVWVHGFEARAWEELSFNFTEEDLVKLRPRLENANVERRITMSEVMQYPNAHVIYVSHFMRAVAEGFAQTEAKNPYVIPNVVDPNVFPYRPKVAEDRKSILWLRSFSANNYASDISRDVLLGLSKQPWFSELKITIVGQGKYFEEMTKPFQKFSNITIQEAVVDRKYMQKLFRSHGVKLVPTRWDSQGLTACEAMHSGLVPLTSYVAGLREYVDSGSAVLAELDDAQDLIDGYIELYENPEKFLEMSKAAHLKSATLCGPKNTTDREIKLIRTQLKKAK